MSDMIEVPKRMMKIMTPIWTPLMGRRLGNVRVHRGMIQEEFAEVLSTPNYRVHPRQLSYLEIGRRARLPVSWKHLEKVLTTVELDYVLLAEGTGKFDHRPSYNSWVKMRRERGAYRRSNSWETTHEARWAAVTTLPAPGVKRPKV